MIGTRRNAASVADIVSERGGATSHFAIIAKQLGIPVVSKIPNALQAIVRRVLRCGNRSGGSIAGNTLKPGRPTSESVRNFFLM